MTSIIDLKEDKDTLSFTMKILMLVSLMLSEGLL